MGIWHISLYNTGMVQARHGKARQGKGMDWKLAWRSGLAFRNSISAVAWQLVLPRVPNNRNNMNSSYFLFDPRKRSLRLPSSQHTFVSSLSVFQEYVYFGRSYNIEMLNPRFDSVAR